MTTDTSNSDETAPDESLITLRRLFNHANHSVEAADGALGEYLLKVEGGHLGGDRKQTARRLGFTERGTFVHLHEERGEDGETETVAVLSVYFDDGRRASGERA